VRRFGGGSGREAVSVSGSVGVVSGGGRASEGVVGGSKREKKAKQIRKDKYSFNTRPYLRQKNRIPNAGLNRLKVPWRAKKTERFARACCGCFLDDGLGSKPTEPGERDSVHIPAKLVWVKINDQCKSSVVGGGGSAVLTEKPWAKGVCRGGGRGGALGGGGRGEIDKKKNCHGGREGERGG